MRHKLKRSRVPIPAALAAVLAAGGLAAWAWSWTSTPAPTARTLPAVTPEATISDNVPHTVAPSPTENKGNGAIPRPGRSVGHSPRPAHSGVHRPVAKPSPSDHRTPTLRPSATAKPSVPVRTPTPRPTVTVTATPTPTPKPTPTVGITEQLRALLPQPKARYVGMDAYAQDIADRKGPLDKGPYAVGISVQGAFTAADARAALGNQTDGYSKIGIGYSAGYWVIVLNP